MKFCCEPDITDIRSKVHTQICELLSADYYKNIAYINLILDNHSGGRGIDRFAKKAALECLVFTDASVSDIDKRFGVDSDAMYMLYVLNLEFSKLLDGSYYQEQIYRRY